MRKNKFQNFFVAKRTLDQTEIEIEDKEKRIKTFKPTVQSHLRPLCDQITEDVIFNLCQDVTRRVTDSEMPPGFVMEHLLHLLINQKHTRQALVFSTLMSIIEKHSPVNEAALYAVLHPDVLLPALQSKNPDIIRVHALLFKFDKNIDPQMSVFVKYTRMLGKKSALNHLEELVSKLIHIVDELHKAQDLLYFDARELLVNVIQWMCHPKIEGGEEAIRSLFAVLEEFGNNDYTLTVLDFLPNTETKHGILKYIFVDKFVHVDVLNQTSKKKKSKNPVESFDSIDSFLKYRLGDESSDDPNKWEFYLELLCRVKDFLSGSIDEKVFQEQIKELEDLISGFLTVKTAKITSQLEKLKK